MPAVSTTAQLEGDTIAAAAANNTVRNSNQCQILYRSAAVTGTQAAIDRAGVNDAMAHQLSIMSRALKRDVEKLMLGNSVVNTGAAGTARTSAGILAKLATNISKASNGANPTAAQAAVGSTARTDGTARAFTEALLKAVLKGCFRRQSFRFSFLRGSFSFPRVVHACKAATKVAANAYLMFFIDRFRFL